MEYSKILIRATNWVGDAVMCLPALHAIRERYSRAHIAILAKPWVADLYSSEDIADQVIPYTASSIAAKWQTGRELAEHGFDCAILLQNAFEAALLAWLARIPNRIGYNRDGRGFLLTCAIPVPKPGEIPPHQRFYYLELLRRAGIIGALPDRQPSIVRGRVSASAVIGVSPGAAYGTAKRWLPERFAEAAAQLARERGASIALFGSKSERALCEEVAGLLGDVPATNYAGATSLAEFIDLASGCELFLTNDSGAMHIASALGVPTVAIFGATDDAATGPAGPLARVVREPVECSPCLLRECPIDHRCMTRVSAGRVVAESLELLALNLSGHPH
ncbi:MAG: lipopolysaccharide heptosyltransferase II [Bryobacteraceae bacterium]